MEKNPLKTKYLDNLLSKKSSFVYGEFLKLDNFFYTFINSKNRRNINFFDQTFKKISKNGQGQRVPIRELPSSFSTLVGTPVRRL